MCVPIYVGIHTYSDVKYTTLSRFAVGDFRKVC